MYAGTGKSFDSCVVRVTHCQYVMSPTCWSMKLVSSSCA